MKQTNQQPARRRFLAALHGGSLCLSSLRGTEKSFKPWWGFLIFPLALFFTSGTLRAQSYLCTPTSVFAPTADGLTGAVVSVTPLTIYCPSNYSYINVQVNVPNYQGSQHYSFKVTSDPGITWGCGPYYWYSAPGVCEAANEYGGPQFTGLLPAYGQWTITIQGWNFGPETPIGNPFTFTFISGPTFPIKGADLGACKQCQSQAGAPVNVTNGNAWIQQRDYSLPGLGGGLELVRTWNSHWQDVSPPSVVGMFGNSWMSTYEERLTGPDGNGGLRYWRADGSAWTFHYANGTYTLTAPLDEHVALIFNTVTNQFVMAMADGTQRIFNQPGYLIALVDRNGNTTSMGRDPNTNQLNTVTDATGRTITFTYNTGGQVVSAADGVGTFATYSYNGGGTLSQVSYPDNSVLSFSYDSNSMITSVKDGNNKLLEQHSFDAYRDALTSTRANSVDSLTLSYGGGQTQLSDSMGNSTTYNYQTTGGRNVIAAVSGSGCSSCGGRGNQTLTYDSSGDVASVTDALSNTMFYFYDAFGNVTTKCPQLVSGQCPASGGAGSLTWTYTYNGFQEVTAATDPLGNTTNNVYDANGNLTSTTTPPPGGSGAGLTTSFTYDSKGELTKVTDPRLNATTIAYTSAGLIASTADAQSNATSFAYDARGNRVSTTDALNNVTSFSYDSMNRLTQITQPGNIVTTFAYDSRGRRTSATDANNKTTSYGYDDADRLLSVTDAANNITSYQYGTENTLASITDAAGHVTNFTYDALGRVTLVTFPAGQGVTESYAYDGVGNLSSKTDRKGQTINYSYDNLYRLTKKAYPDSTAVNYTYDAVNRLTQAVDPTGTYSFTYDNIGRPTATTIKYAFLGRVLTLLDGFNYDVDSDRTSMTDPEGRTTNFSYDTLDRLTSLADVNGTFGFGYDGLSRRTSLTRSNGVSTNYAYDNLSRLLSVTHQLSGSTIDGASYVPDNVGNRTSKTDLRTQAATSFGYDATYQLRSATQGGNATESYRYDAVGNRLSSLTVPIYVYNASNELTSTSVPGPVTTVYNYDANGNLTSKTGGGATATYTWDFENRLSSATVNGVTTNFKYDPFGRRVYKSSSSGTHVYVYDGDNLIEELNLSGGEIAHYTPGPGIDEPLAELRSGTASFYQADGLGSITSLSNSAGALANTYVYDSFGNLTASSGSVTNPYQFTARDFDSETGLYYYRARYYDSSVGRFLSEDPARFVQGINFYPYVYNDPVNLLDPMGLVAGPKEPRVSTHCDDADPCPTLLGKMQLLEKTIRSHSGWDLHMPAPRGGGRHAEEIANYWRAWANCQRIWISKCVNQKCPEELRLEEESARRMESFWKTILYGLPAIPIGYSLPVLAPALGPVLTENPAFAY